MKKFSEFGISLDLIKNYQVLCLPENFDREMNVNELIESNDTINLSKMLKQANITCGNSYDLKINPRILERRHSDRWFGLIWIRDHLVVPIVTGVVVGILVADLAKSNNSLGVEKRPDVHISIVIQNDDSFTNFKYDGDPETLEKLFNGLSKKSQEKRE